MAKRYRQEVLNVLLAQLLQERGVVAAPESMLKLGIEQRRRIPDVIVSFRGLRTAIEGEMAEQPHAKRRAVESARKRVEEGIAHLGVAVVYPEGLRESAFERLKAELAGSEIQIAILSESQVRPVTESTGTVDDLESALRHAFDHLVREDVVAQAVAKLDAAIEDFAGTVVAKRGIMGRLADVLGMGKTAEKRDPRVPRELPEKQRNAISRICGLVLINAMMFQEILNEEHDHVDSLEEMLKDVHILRALNGHWRFILEEIDYKPIFHLAQNIAITMGSNRYVLMAVRALCRTAQEIVDMRAPLRHDLMGRVYHRLLAEKKYLATYYTKIPAATLLLKLALRSEAWSTRWHDLGQLRTFTLADLACGTGTLLAAAAETVTDNYVSAAAGRGEKVDLVALQEVLAEKILRGYDVVPSAVHLTASALALRAPAIPFRKMNMFNLPIGGPNLRLGSIEYLKGNTLQMQFDLFGAEPAAEQVRADSSEKIPIAPVPPLDVCVMNPPFTRSVGGNLLFGSSPEEERKRMQTELKKLVQKHKVPASITAGLGSVFVAVADPFIKTGGRLALVLPKALLSGVAWDRTRQLLRRRYHVEYIVSSHDPRAWNFSESTSLSEVLLLARKIENNDRCDNANTVAVNLWRNPGTSFEALSIAQTLARGGCPYLETGQGALSLMSGEEKTGEAVSVPWRTLRDWPSWLFPCAFAQSDLSRAAVHLIKGNLWLPGHGVVREIRLREVKDLGALGPDCRDIHDGFQPRDEVSPYPAFWSHDAKSVHAIAQKPNRYLDPLPAAKEGRPLRTTEALWPLAGRILLAERLRLNSQSLCAIRVTKPVLANVWWPFSLKKRIGSVQREKALTLWLNSTLGLILTFFNREETEGAWVKFKKPVLARLPVLDVSVLSREQSRQLANTFDRLARTALNPFPRMADDSVRAEIDESIAQVLGLPDFTILREMLAREPIVCLKPL